MKHLLRAIIFMSLLSALFGGDRKPEPKSTPGWAIAKVTTGDGGVGVFRYREAKPEDLQSIRLAEEISITWKYGGALPDKVASEKMAAFEDAMERLSDSSESKLVLVMTVGGSREWCYYAADYDAFMRVLNQCLSGKPRVPIAIEHSSDPEWKYWHSFIDRVAKR